jgi:cytochrome c oxidase cbb3-type subunit 3
MCVALVVAGCKPHGGSTTNQASQALQPVTTPLGDVAGAAKVHYAAEIDNPLAANAAAVAQGEQLFISLNCAGCHGYGAGGGMGPSLIDQFWRYGGTPSGIYQSIHEGRPQGMPAWGRAMPPQEIWKLVSYIDSLGGALAPDNYHAGLQGDHDVSSVATTISRPAVDLQRSSEVDSAINAAPPSTTPLHP